MKIVVLHCYSAANAGDGLLVDETIDLIRSAFGSATQIIIAASHPDSFHYLDVDVVDSGLSKRGYSFKYIQLLRSLDSVDIVVAVGGGYLRAGFPIETAKTILVHGPQLAAAARTQTPTIYMPQSVGPANPIVARWLSKRIRKIDRFYVRDDRSASDFSGANVIRSSDLALLQLGNVVRNDLDVHPTPVLSIRAVRGRVSTLVQDLACQLAEFDGYIQSATAGNNDTDSMNSIGPQRILSRSELIVDPVRPRVVVAVRLHAALMAIRSGHFVIHLAYERKGFGAFGDLGLEQYVHNVNMFEPERVLRQVRVLLTSQVEREAYSASVRAAARRLKPVRDQLVQELSLMHKPGNEGTE
ncbi:hypothetical protein CH278_05945 [Rhodococcus sp. 05-2254-5]|uniref:polysaccharide pyruvyl transferase family protein n=1 Tax=unclassified Rhodococcus (in: high G+C Gram-positive bacteria) TaxID=192944 RepID=UPI000B9B3D5D|nr:MULTISPECIES: polysaccharide pyruvyl transferase family protein [unclassified Rhodococcus (in: high G+C Gram-positive bacteria)]OZE36429.1 hypothetical protein CH278_05945 [Rhodococcus sp. 05-2254-5]OZE62093.1 hypothetical protein CH269_02535 [Rhodococcus sp. 05-2254-1]